LARVREAAHAGRAYRVHVPQVELVTGYVGGGEDLVVRFVAEAQAVGGFAEVALDLAAARVRLTELLRQYSVRSALCWQHPVLERLRLSELLSELDISRSDYGNLASLPHDQRRAQILGAEIGISSCTYAVAETGSLAVASGPGTERVASLTPPIHVAVVTADQILPDLFDLFARFETAGLDSLPSNLVLITGPSKTGDLELKLTTGVHGPGKWHVIAVRDGA
jgi:L-lactate dehydrogenase complex protein LldG